jgi:GntR family transcriptional regulator/MocR family aminotransferase
MPKTAITGSLLSFAIDRSSTVPIYRQIVQHLKDAIASGRIAPGSKLPSTRVFADELGVSRNTAVQVFEALTAEGMLVCKVGAGTFVAESSDLIEGAGVAVVAPVARASGRPYPFRSLSRRGRSLLASASDEFAERPRSFMPDVPDLREFPIKTWLRLLGETSGRLTGEILADTTNAGYEPLRRALAQHLGSTRGMKCDWRQVIVTTGSQQSLDLTCRMLIDPGDPVWLEEPGYVGARSIIRANSGVVCPVPVDVDGMCVESAALSHPVARVIYVSAARQYPLGMTLSQPRREALLQYARASGAWILEDDYDHEFRYVGHSPQAIHGMDRDSRTIHIGTFSKILLPSFRLGYMVVPSDLSEAFAKARAVVDRHASLIEQMVLSEFMHRGLLVSHIRRMRSLYRERQCQLIDGLHRLLGAELHFTGTETGLHLVMPFAPDVDDVSFARSAALAGVVVRPLSPYYATRQRRKGLLLGFAAFNQRDIEAGLELLAPLRGDLRQRLLLSPP